MQEGGGEVPAPTRAAPTHCSLPGLGAGRWALTGTAIQALSEPGCFLGPSSIPWR